jgi:NADH:ubiquinone oxidoreductase subunit F (NADH-binding)
MKKEEIQNSTQLLMQQLLSNGRKDGSKKFEEILPSLKRERINTPIVYIGITDSSIVAGAMETLQAIQKYISEREVDISVVEVGSLGLCSLEPIIDVQIPGRTRVAFQRVTSDQVADILDGVLNSYLPTEQVLGQYRNPIHQPWLGVPYIDEISFFKFQHRALLKNCGIICPDNIDDYLAIGGYNSFTQSIRNFTHEEICDIIEKSGLRGRGGGGFPTGQKWKMALKLPADQKIFICNADESDPGAFMERLLAESNPHLIIEGIAIGAYAIGSGKAIIYTRNRYSLVVKRFEIALKQAYQAGLLGHNILDSGFNLEIEIRKGPGAYVCGEETALIQSLEGKRGMPTQKPPYPASNGLFRKPTVVNNVETIANIPLILKRGHNWFSSIGTEKSRGTKLFSISGKVNQTCVVEVPLGVSLAKIVELAGGVPKGKKLKAVHIGGPSGGCITPENLNVPIDYETLKEKGLTMGSGGVNVFDDSVCIVDMVKYFMGFIQNESCGKCIPCREGSRRMLEILGSISRRPITENEHDTLERFKGVIQLEGLAKVMSDTSLCGLGKTAPNPLFNALKHFRQEFEEHIYDRKCAAGVCKNLRTYYIDVEKCTGCTLCEKKCPTNAIYGTPRSPYFIIEEKCIGCGICDEVCKFSAVFFK